MCDEKEINEVFLNVTQVAEFLGVGCRTVWRYDRLEKIPAPKKFGRLKRWNKTTLELWIKWDRPNRKIFNMLLER